MFKKDLQTHKQCNSACAMFGKSRLHFKFFDNTHSYTNFKQEFQALLASNPVIKNVVHNINLQHENNYIFYMLLMIHVRELFVLLPMNLRQRENFDRVLQLVLQDPAEATLLHNRLVYMNYLSHSFIRDAIKSACEQNLDKLLQSSLQFNSPNFAQVDDMFKQRRVLDQIKNKDLTKEALTSAMVRCLFDPDGQIRKYVSNTTFLVSCSSSLAYARAALYTVFEISLIQNDSNAFLTCPSHFVSDNQKKRNLSSETLESNQKNNKKTKQSDEQTIQSLPPTPPVLPLIQQHHLSPPQSVSSIRLEEQVFMDQTADKYLELLYLHISDQISHVKLNILFHLFDTYNGKQMLNHYDEILEKIRMVCGSDILNQTLLIVNPLYVQHMKQVKEVTEQKETQINANQTLDDPMDTEDDPPIVIKTEEPDSTDSSLVSSSSSTIPMSLNDNIASQTIHQNTSNNNDITLSSSSSSVTPDAFTQHFAAIPFQLQLEALENRPTDV
jgi:hypothetical protein